MKKARKKALVCFITAGHPGLKQTLDLVLSMEEAGADIVELGVPFSDPLADGAVIQESSRKAIEAGTTLLKIINLVSEIRKRSRVPVVLMGYYNVFHAFGISAFPARAAAAGVDGLIIPDLPPEEAGDLKEGAGKNGLDTIFLAAPTSTEERIRLIARASTGFIYYVSVTGVTGARRSMSRDIGGMVGKIKKHTDKPVVVGFGISKPDQAGNVARHADGVVVGSAIVRLIDESGRGPALARKVGKFVSSLRKGIDRG